ncbi:hypothetical protein [uncultured Brevibacillus sp.]|uniref:hypothetical protein n=1 Tax=uncultured Brevibacillus sp. TaxID=169970 RepID=UPI00259A57E4|nr:hypothetical protein [uncultured Brevibacillus sp.]
MDHFYKYIDSVRDVNELERLREQIKDQVIDPALNWESRMPIYRKVQVVTERIEHLKNNPHAI